MKAAQHRMVRNYAAAVAAVALVPLAVAASAGASSYPKTWTAVTVITSRPISGTHNNRANGAGHTWADSSFTRAATVTFYAQVASSFCPGITQGQCYYWTGEAVDTKGTFTTNPTVASGAYSPGNGTGGTGAAGPFMIGAAVTGVVAGRYHYGFYASAGSAKAATMPSAENDHETLPLSPTTSTCTGGASCGVTNCLWIEQFFPSGTQFWNLGHKLDPSCLGLYGSWFYFARPGADVNCSLVTSKWVTASWNNWGRDPVDGNIFAPDAAHC